MPIDMTSKLLQVLLVEDDPLIARTLQLSLPFKGLKVTACDSCKLGMETFRAGTFDVVLLDINLPDGNGLDLCQEIRKTHKNIPVLMLTAKTDEQTAVRGLELGADDYIRKPYGIQELTARIMRLLDRQKSSTPALQFASVRIDPDKRMAWAYETPLSLGRREFDILSLLIRKKGDVVTRNEILNALSQEADVYDRTIDSHLSHLRKKLRDAGIKNFQIIPVYGVGYRLEEG